MENIIFFLRITVLEYRCILHRRFIVMARTLKVMNFSIKNLERGYSVMELKVSMFSKIPLKSHRRINAIHYFLSQGQNMNVYRILYEPRCEKICLRGFRPDPTQTGLYNNGRPIGVWNFGFKGGGLILHVWRKQRRWSASFEPHSEKTGLRGFRPGPTQTRLYSHRIWPEAWNFGFRQ